MITFSIGGGHSLTAMKVMNRVQDIFSTSLTLRNLFQLPTIAGLASLIREGTHSPAAEIEPLPERPYYELSYAQQRLWLLSKMGPQNNAYNLPVKITLYEAVEPLVIQAILDAWTMRHESFRTWFKEIDEYPVQVIEPAVPGGFKLEVSDWSSLEEAERAGRRSRLLKDEASQVFNLEQCPLSRARLIKYSAQEYDFVLNMHHIITDGWSLDILRQEFTRWYETYKAGNSPGSGIDWEPPRIRYKDYAAWQNRLLEDEEKMSKAKAFWKDYLSGVLPGLNLPYDSSPGPDGPRSRTSSAYSLMIDPKITQDLRAFADQHQGSLFMVLLTAFNLMLSHITGQEEILMAVPAAARQHGELKNLIGMFVNTLILRSRIDMTETLSDLFRAVRANTFEALEYQGFPLELIFIELKMKYPDISVLFNMVDIGSQAQRSQAQGSTSPHLKNGHSEEVQEAKFALVIYLSQSENGVRVSCHYFRELFRPATIERIMGLYARVLENMSKDPGKKAKEYVISPQKKNILGKRHIKSFDQTFSKVWPPAGPPEATLAIPKINREAREAQHRLSRVNSDFLDYVEKNPGCFDTANFQALDLHDDLFRLQPWPTFIGAKTKEAFRQVGVGLFDLVKQIPARVFGYDPQRMSAFYETPPEVLALELEGVTTAHLENLVGRGDFILSGSGIKCLEYNVSSNLGGLEIPTWETLYRQTPILEKFFNQYRVNIKNENLLGLLLEHALHCSREKFGPQENPVNIALVMNGYDEKESQGKRIHNTRAYLNRLYKEILQRQHHTLSGEVLVCDYQHLKVTEKGTFLRDKKIHVIQEGYNGMVPADLMNAFKAGNFCLFNGPITKLLSHKLNLAVLSDPALNHVFTGEEQRFIAHHMPWTRKITPGQTTYQGETLKDLEHFILTHREHLVIKPTLGYGGDSVRIGKQTPPSQWEQSIKTALDKKNWLVQEWVEVPGGVYQSGSGWDYHDMVWGFFIFGSRYSGTWLRVMPKALGKGVVNCHAGAGVSIVFEVDE